MDSKRHRRFYDYAHEFFGRSKSYMGRVELVQLVERVELVERVPPWLHESGTLEPFNQF